MNGDITPGRRVRPDPSEVYFLGEPGDYYVHPADGKWHARTPNSYLANLSRHEVVEHEDGTITVAPSILVSGPNSEERWHGFLERGVWREV